MGRLAGIARREKKRAPMETLESTPITETEGVVGDSRGKPGIRQVTLLSADAWRAACRDAGAEAHWTVRRSNLLVEDIELPRRSGAVIAIGDVRLRTTVEVDPCSRMDEQVPGMTEALKPDWRGGVGCEVVAGGVVRVGDTVEIIE